MYVKQETPVTTKHDVLGDIAFNIETGHVESVEAAQNDAGGAQGLVDRYNSQRDTGAKNAARAFARNFPVADGTDPATYPELVRTIEVSGQAIARDYNPAAESERGPSKAKKAAGFDAISAMLESGQDISREALFAILAGAK